MGRAHGPPRTPPSLLSSSRVFQEELDFANDGVECLSDRNECVVRMGNYGANGNHFSVQCDTCSRWFHGCCVGFSSEYDVPDIWHCSSCVRSSEEAVGALLSARNDIDLPQGSLRAMPALVEAREEIFDPSLTEVPSHTQAFMVGELRKPAYPLRVQMARVNRKNAKRSAK